MKKIPLQIKELLKREPAAACIGAALIVFTADYYTGTLIRFPIFYVIPVIMASWMEKKALAYTMAITLPLLRIVFHIPLTHPDPLPETLINTLIRMAALSLIAYLVDRAASQAKRLTILEGVLPICASCKRIRNDKGEYEQMENYITDHSEASFSHGLCPECSKKLYPEFYDRQIKLTN